MLVDNIAYFYGKAAQKIYYYRTIRILKKIFEEDNFIPTDNLPTIGNKIGIIIPSFVKASGGVTSILRLGSNLEKLGYDITFISMANEPIEKMKETAKFNLKNYQGNLSPLKDVEKDIFDIVVATSWTTVYEARKFKGYLMYFVQDFESIFYDTSDLSVIAKKTYELGLHMVSLGRWNKKMIEENCISCSPVDFIEFPYEKSEYSKFERNFNRISQTKKIKIAVYIKEENKRLPVIIPMILDKLKIMLLESGYQLEINYFGNSNKVCLQNGNELGKLSKEQLYELYCNSDFGMVASLTNISLVPYEMVATGLPVIEFEDGTFKYFFEENTAILCDLNIKKLHDNIIKLINNPDDLFDMSNRAFNCIKNLSWEESSMEFANIIERARNAR